MNPQDELTLAEKSFERTKADHAKRIESLRAEIDDLEAKGLRHENVDERLERAKHFAEVAERIVGKRLEDARASFEKWEADRKQKADEVESKRKAEALRAWIRNGGAADEFEKAYPALKAAILSAAVVADIQKQAEPKRPMFGTL